jgi:hypothetical protein
VFATVGFFIGLASCCCGVYGCTEFRVGGNASAEPVLVDLAKVEADPKVDNHLKIGTHYALYDNAVYSFKTKGNRFQRAENVKVDYVFYPIVSASNPDMQELTRLEKQFGNIDNVPDEIDLPIPEHFAVLVKTRRFSHVRDIPQDFFRKEASIQGLVINEVSSLTSAEKNLIKDSFPQINFDKVLILEDGRRPTSPQAAIATMATGGVCSVFALVSFVAGCAMYIKAEIRKDAATKRRRKKKKSD